MSRKENGSRTDLYARITEKIVVQLENGVRPWVQPWRASHVKGRITRPLRHNGEPYTGMNVLLLWSEAMAQGYAAPIWMTFRHAGELGAHVRKGETSATVIFASRFTKTESDAQGSEVDRDIPFLKAYGVFNVEQIEGLPDHYYHRPQPVEDPIERIENAQAVEVEDDAVDGIAVATLKRTHRQSQPVLFPSRLSHGASAKDRSITASSMA